MRRPHSPRIRLPFLCNAFCKGCFSYHRGSVSWKLHIPHQILRQGFVLNHQFQRNTGIQYRELERNSFDRFVLYLVAQYFQFFVEPRVDPLTAYLDTIEALNHAPSLAINLFENL